MTATRLISRLGVCWFETSYLSLPFSAFHSTTLCHKWSWPLQMPRHSVAIIRRNEIHDVSHSSVASDHHCWGRRWKEQHGPPEHWELGPRIVEIREQVRRKEIESDKDCCEPNKSKQWLSRPRGLLPDWVICGLVCLIYIIILMTAMAEMMTVSRYLQ